jgi:hypothetical protein
MKERTRMRGRASKDEEVPEHEVLTVEGQEHEDAEGEDVATMAGGQRAGDGESI